MQKNVLVIPGFFSLASSHLEYTGVDIWLKNISGNNLKNAEWVIAHSAGANYLLSRPISPNQKIILINPLILRRSFINLFFRDIYFLFSEKQTGWKIIPLSSWSYAFKKLLKLLKVNILNELQKLPKENIFIIRGKKDYYFCDEKSVKIIEKEGLNLFEVDAGHLWNDKMALRVRDIIN